jgi:hypothetical protein
MVLDLLTLTLVVALPAIRSNREVAYFCHEPDKALTL